MNSLSRNELIKALVKGLKLDDNIFNYQAVAEETEQVQEKDFMDFYKATMSENTYGNGLQAIMKTVEKFKPQQTTDLIAVQANELIDLVHSMNNTVYQEHIKSGVRFDDLLEAAKFPTVSDEDIAILNNVKPHMNLKLLIAGINTYNTSVDTLFAFKNAILENKSNQSLLVNNRVGKLLKK